MTAEADEWIAFAQESLIENGVIGIITRIQQATVYNPAELSYDETLEEEEEPTDPLEPLTWSLAMAPVDFNFKEIQQYNVVTGQKALYVEAGSNYYPEIGDKITMDKDYRLIECLNDFKLNGVVCAFLLKIGV